MNCNEHVFVPPLVLQVTTNLLKSFVPWAMTTDADTPTEPEEDFLGNLPLAAVSPLLFVYKESH